MSDAILRTGTAAVEGGRRKFQRAQGKTEEYEEQVQLTSGKHNAEEGKWKSVTLEELEKWRKSDACGGRGTGKGISGGEKWPCQKRGKR